MDSDVPSTIRALREAAGMASKDLAAALGLSASTMSLIESGNRALKASELVTIAKALGVSPLAIIEPASLVGRVSIAARTTETTCAQQSLLLRRLQGIAEMASLLEPESNQSAAMWSWEDAPPVDLNDWLASARALAQWALRASDEVEPDGDHFVKTALYIQIALGVDVVVESFDDAVIGGAIVGNELPLIVVNSKQGRNRALFTLAHELGHVLADHGQEISCDVDFKAASPIERFANAFAAEFLMPIPRVDELISPVTDIRAAVVRLMLGGGLSKQTSIYRLHNRGIINAGQRDALRELHISEMAAAEPDPKLRQILLTRSDELAPRVVAPLRLLGRLIDGYRIGLVSAAPIAGILGSEIDDVIDRYGADPADQLAADVDLRTSEPSVRDESAFAGVPA